MKKLENLIEDIYKPLEELSNGVPLPLSEKALDETLERIKGSILGWANPTERDRAFNLRMSNIGRPARLLWYQKRDDSESAINASTQIKFLYGHILEEILLMLVKLSGHSLTDQQKPVEVEGILGHIDCKIDGEVIDVKTASNFSFNKFKFGKLSEDDPFGYLGQLEGYEKAEGTSRGGFLVINKESGEICLFQPEELDKPNIITKIQNLKKSLELETKPEKCYDPIPDGKKGNMKIAKPCVYCKYKHDCHSDTNGGEGLRTFKYSTGYVYLTHVEKTPQVEEII